MIQKAYAKINLALDVLEKDLKTGYHKIWTVIQQIDLHDELEFKEIPGSNIIIKSNDPSLPVDENNTVYQAVLRMAETLGGLKNMPSGIQITIQKNIPVSAGLGGGSSDAAATLKALNKIWKRNLSNEELEAIARKIGMDVPFFIRGGLSFAEHYGEIIEPLPPYKKKWEALLIDPGQTMQTAHAYTQIDHFPNARDLPKTKKLLSILKNPDTTNAQEAGENLAELIHNDFDQLYDGKFQPLRQKLMEFQALSVTCAGSGACHFAVFKNTRDLDYAEAELQKTPWKARKIQAFKAEDVA